MSCDDTAAGRHVGASGDAVRTRVVAAAAVAHGAGWEDVVALPEPAYR